MVDTNVDSGAGGVAQGAPEAIESTPKTESDLHGDGNKFQQAISAWRSECSFVKTQRLADVGRYRSYIIDHYPRQHGLVNCHVPTRLYSSAQGFGSKNERFQKA